jgi:hypothetical protein
MMHFLSPLALRARARFALRATGSGAPDLAFERL